MLDALKGLTDFFGMIGDIVKSLLNFFVMMFNGIMLILKLLPRSVAFLMSAIGYLPPFIVPFAIASIMTIAVYAFIKLARG